MRKGRIYLSIGINSLQINYVIRSFGRTRSQSNVQSKLTTYSRMRRTLESIDPLEMFRVRLNSTCDDFFASKRISSREEHTRTSVYTQLYSEISFSIHTDRVDPISEYNSSVITIRKYIHIYHCFLSFKKRYTRT